MRIRIWIIAAGLYLLIMKPEDRPLVDALYAEIDYLCDLLRLYVEAYDDLFEQPINEG